MNDYVYKGNIPGEHTGENVESGEWPGRTDVYGNPWRNDVPLSQTGAEMKEGNGSIGE